MSSPVAELKPSIARFRRDLLAWGRTHRRSFPWRETTDPFRVLVAEVLLQRSRGVTVAKVYDELFRRWPDAEHLARAHEASIATVIRPLGLVRRAATLRTLANEIIAIGEVPSQLDRLTELPGVGRYAAGATLAVAFDKPAPVVDGVTARVYKRYFGAHSELPASADPQLWSLTEEASPKRGVREWNWAVLDLAAMVCLPKVPKCVECPLRSHCSWARAAA